MKATAVTLASALHRAGEAHHIFEAKLGKPDADWATFYARHVKENSGLIPQDMTVEKLSGLLSRYAQDFDSKSVPGQTWEGYYGARLLSEISDKTLGGL